MLCLRIFLAGFLLLIKCMGGAAGLPGQLVGFEHLFTYFCSCFYSAWDFCLLLLFSLWLIKVNVLSCFLYFVHIHACHRWCLYVFYCLVGAWGRMVSNWAQRGLLCDLRDTIMRCCMICAPRMPMAALLLNLLVPGGYFPMAFPLFMKMCVVKGACCVMCVANGACCVIGIKPH